MNQEKIGNFIAERRKNINLTQAQLAEKLNITDRAISKWERGKAMPDSSIMLELCDILKITVNDLLSGEVVTLDNYNKEHENNLLEMIKQKELADKRLLTIEWVLGILSILILLIPILIASYIPMKDYLRIILVFSGVIPCFIGFISCMKIEQIAGYYECKECGHKYVPSFKTINLAPHMGRTRYMCCPKCGKKSWQKKVISKN